VLIVGVLLLSSSGCLNEIREEKSPILREGELSDIEWEWYESEEKEFKIKYPKGWEEAIFEDFPPEWKALEETYAFYDPSYSEPQIVYLQIRYLDEGTNSNYKAAYDLLKQYKETSKDFQCEGFTNSSLANEPSIKSTYSFNAPGLDPVKMQYTEDLAYYKLSLICGRNGKYKIEFGCRFPDPKEASETFDAYLPIFNEMVISFEYTK
jgi:hypothetical protein